MANEMIREMIRNNLDEDKLYHHGILNMSWGVRNGPPYPLSGSGKSLSTMLRAKKRKAQAKARLKKNAKEQKATMDLERKKQKLIASGNMKAIRKHRDWFSNDEIEAAIKRNMLLYEAQRTVDRKKQGKYDRRQDRMERRQAKKDAKRREELAGIVNATDKLGAITKNITPIAELAIKLGANSRNKKDWRRKVRFEDIDRSRKLKADDADRATKSVQDRFNMLKGVNEKAALDFFNDIYGTHYTQPAKVKGFDMNVFNSLTRLNPDAAASYMTSILGSDVKYDRAKLEYYVKTGVLGGGGGKQKSSGGSGGSSGGGSSE